MQRRRRKSRVGAMPSRAARDGPDRTKSRTTLRLDVFRGPRRVTLTCFPAALDAVRTRPARHRHGFPDIRDP